MNTRILLAIAERLTSRGASAAITFLMAFYVAPRIAGYYATGTLILGFCQAVAEGTLRQVGPLLWNSLSGAALLRRASTVGAIASFLISLISVIVLYLTGYLSGDDIGWMLILPPVALVDCYFVPQITLLQYQGEWRTLVRNQSLGAVASLAIALPLLPITGLGAAILQTLISDGLFAILSTRARRVTVATLEAVYSFRSLILPTSITNVLGWLQGQLDRLTIALVAGSTSLGLYSFALALARTATEALLSGVLNLVRSELSRSAGREGRVQILIQTLQRTVVITSALQLVVTLASWWPLPQLLSSRWACAISTAPLLAASGVPAAAAWCFSACIIHEGRAKALVWPNVISVLLSVAAGALAPVSLLITAAVVVIRDLSGATIRRAILGETYRAVSNSWMIWSLSSAVFGAGATFLLAR